MCVRIWSRALFLNKSMWPTMLTYFAPFQIIGWEDQQPRENMWTGLQIRIYPLALTPLVVCGLDTMGKWNTIICLGPVECIPLPSNILPSQRIFPVKIICRALLLASGFSVTTERLSAKNISKNTQLYWKTWKGPLGFPVVNGPLPLRQTLSWNPH